MDFLKKPNDVFGHIANMMEAAEMTMDKDSFIKNKIKAAIIGNFLLEEYRKLQTEPDLNIFHVEKSKQRANAKAEILAEIILSGMKAKELKTMLDDNIKNINLFFPKFECQK